MTAMKRFNDSYDYQKANWHDKWERDNKLYDEERVRESYIGTTDTFIPLPFSTIETMTSALNNAEIKVDYKSRDPSKNVSMAPLNALVDEYAEDDNWALNSEDSYREVLKVGMDANMLMWDIDHPHEETFAMRDAVLDPTVKNPAQLQQPGYYAGRRYFVRKGALDDYQVVDTDEASKTYGELIPRFKKTTDDSASNSTDKPTDAQIKEMFSGSTLKNAVKDQDEIIEIWDVDRVVTVKNRSQVIEDRINPFKEKHEQILRARYIDQATQTAQAAPVDELNPPDPAEIEKAIQDAKTRAKSEAKGVVPFYFYRNYRKKSLFYADSELNAIYKEIERLNDNTNMESDYIIKQIASQRELDPEYEDWIDLIDDDPATVYPFKPGSLQNIGVPILPANAFNDRQEIKSTIRETTAMSEVANGALSHGDKTKFEVGSALSQTGARIESKARIFTADALYWKYYILLKMIQLYVDKPLLVDAPEADVDRKALSAKYGFDVPEGTAVFDPADYQGDLKPRISLEVDAEAKQSDSRKEARENYQIIIQDPTNNLQEAKKILYPKMFKMSKEDLKKIMTPPPAPAPAPAGTPTVAPDGMPVAPAPAPALGGEASAPIAQPMTAPVGAQGA